MGKIAYKLAQFDIPPAEGTNLPEQTNATEIILSVANYLLSIAGLLTVLFIIIGGFRFMTAGGNEEAADKAKKTIINAIVGIVVVILSFAIVRGISNALIPGGTP